MEFSNASSPDMKGGNDSSDDNVEDGYREVSENEASDVSDVNDENLKAIVIGNNRL